ncbi:hypothetical protein [Rhizobium herbae]
MARRDDGGIDDGAADFGGQFGDHALAGTAGPFIPWDTPGTAKRLANWDSDKDQWEPYDLKTDFSQATDLAAQNPEKLEEMKKRFLEVAEENKDFPIGAGLWLRTRPQDRVKSSYDKRTFSQTTRRMPEFAAPGVGRQSNNVTISAEFGENANGVLYAVGGSGGGLSVYMEDGHLVYEYNMMIIENYRARTEKIPAGKHAIEIVTSIAKPAGPAEVVITIDGKEAAKTTVARTVPAAFSATESFDVGADLGSTVSQAYFEKRPFEFDGKIGEVHVELTR